MGSHPVNIAYRNRRVPRERNLKIYSRKAPRDRNKTLHSVNPNNSGETRGMNVFHGR